MRWGRKKNCLLSSPRPSLISSWLLKFKKMGSTSEAKAERVKHRDKKNSPVMRSPLYGSGGRFYGGADDGDDAFWRISFGEEAVAGKSSRRVLKSVWYESDDEVDFPESTCRSCRPSATKTGRREETQKFNKRASEARKVRGDSNEVRILPNRYSCYHRENEEKPKTPRRNASKDCKLRKTRISVLEENSELEKETDEAEVKSEKTIEKEILELRPTKTDRRDKDKLTVLNSKVQNNRFSRKQGHSALPATEEDRVLWSSERQKLKERKIDEFKSKTEKHRKAVYMSSVVQGRAPKQNSKARVYSPKTVSKVEACKIKALEDMKKAKLKRKKQIKERIVEVKGRKGLENFAVVKCSFDPQKDFRDSMIEMVMQKRIRHPEELEELLACYLTLNSDEYHDLIVKVFRQVWFELDWASLGAELQHEHCCFDFTS